VIPDPAPPFEVDAPGTFVQSVRRMLDRAAALGLRAEVERAVAEIFNYLYQKPRDWGDPIRDFRNSQMTEYHGRHARFLCVYSVHTRIPTVVVTQLIPQEGNPLFGENFDPP
jgi:hypothetical protein